MKTSCIDRFEGGEKNLVKSILKGEAEGRRWLTWRGTGYYKGSEQISKCIDNNERQVSHRKEPISTERGKARINSVV